MQNMNDIQLKRIKELLEFMHDMADSPDQSESHAQEVMQWGAELYEEIFA